MTIKPDIPLAGLLGLGAGAVIARHVPQPWDVPAAAFVALALFSWWLLTEEHAWVQADEVDRQRRSRAAHPAGVYDQDQEEAPDAA